MNKKEQAKLDKQLDQIAEDLLLDAYCATSKIAFNGAYIPVEEKTADNIVNEYYSWLEKQGEQNFTDNKEKLDLLNFIRKETGCGLAEANNALLKLNKVLKQHPVPIMDKPRKLKIEWEE